MSLADISADWYRKITADPVWKESLAECANATDERDPRTYAPRPCNGDLPLQWATKQDWCDERFYDCADRSDEGDCAGKEQQGANTVVGS